MNKVCIHTLSFSNVFSYGENITIDFKDPVTQLVGPNGSGKSSIPVVLEELFYNKNSRGVKKASVKNRYTNSKSYSMSATFSVNKDFYELSKLVTSTASVKLTKNSEDISGHTATQTYEIIESLLGMDFQTFTKLVYQSMRSNLDFLLATDANRKKFLVSLLGLEHYADVAAKVKDQTTKVKAELVGLQNTVKTMEPYTLKKEPEQKQKIPVPDLLPETEVQKLTEQLEALKLEKQRIDTNNQARARLDSVGIPIAKEPKPDIFQESEEVKELKNKLIVWRSELKTLQVPATKCPTCGTPYNNEEHANHLKSRIEELTALIKEATPAVSKSDEKVLSSKMQAEAYDKEQAAIQKALTTIEALRASVDSTLPLKFLGDIDGISQKRVELSKQIQQAKDLRAKALQYNQEVDLHNAKAAAEIEHIRRIQNDLLRLKRDQIIVQNKLDKLDVLNKVFGTKGLIAYKIESMTKVFEELINEYLSVLSDGQFNLVFQVEDTKLALNLYDGGELVEVESLSSGEFNRVNTATLLAIRKVMSAMAKVDINVLFLDEVISVLDTQGKDTLIEVLLKEENLNTIVVSHGYQHPLARKISVYKDSYGMSRLDHGE